MKTLPIIANQSVDTIKITCSATPIGETAGSAKWLLSLPIEVRFLEDEGPDFVYRVGEITMGTTWMPVIADGACLDETMTTWTQSAGLHDIPLHVNGPLGSLFPLEPGDPELTLGAEDLLSRICESVRKEFRDWVDDRAEADAANIHLELVNF